MASPSSASRTPQEPPRPRPFPGASSAKPSDCSCLTSPLAIAWAEGRHLRSATTLRRAERSLKSWHPPPLSATPVAPTPTSILAAFTPTNSPRTSVHFLRPLPNCHSSCPPKGGPERPDFCIRAVFWRGRPWSAVCAPRALRRGGGIVAPTSCGSADAGGNP